MRFSFFIIGLLYTMRAAAQSTPPAPSAATTHPASPAPLTAPVFQVDFKDPTADKPQSKLWYQGNNWWALLPRSSGPSLWQRTATGWIEHPEVNKTLQKIPGRADVWAEKDAVTAVGVSPDSLVVFRLQGGHAGAPGREPSTHNADAQQWKTRVLATLKPPVKEDIETATIAKDSKGEWWVAADGSTSIYVWHSTDGLTWSKAVLLKTGVSKDDICTITAIKDAVMVIWSNQKDEAVQCREHRDGHAENDWGRETNVEIGHKTADDHLHTARTPDGTVWLVTKNSADSNFYPQLVLRVRHPLDGSWSNFPYAPRTPQAEPSRPTIIAAPGGALLEAHTIYDKTDRYKGRIVFARIDTTANGILTHQQILIQPDQQLHAIVNNCTMSKAPFPAGAPWIVLASDGQGRVYEADLKLLTTDRLTKK
ncbi:MAG TPA: hypothetical protein VGN00_19355 [Puia sp.]|jgi:hypothetical protein